MKKALFFLVFIIFSQNPLFSINQYVEGDTLYVWAEGGLSIRDSNSISGKRIGVIPYGEKIITLSRKIFKINDVTIKLTSKHKDDDGNEYLGMTLKGQWAKINFKGKIGFVFDGYLSKYPAPILRDKGRSERLEAYFTRVLGLNSEKNSTGNDYIIREKYFGNGVSLLNVGTKTANVRYTMPIFSQEEIVLFIKNTKLTNLSGPPRLLENKYFENGNIRVLKFVYDQDGDGGIVIKIFDGMVILVSDASC